MRALTDRGICKWPTDASELRVGVNDTGKAFQSANKGRSASTAEWKAAQSKLLAEERRWQDNVVLFLLASSGSRKTVRFSIGNDDTRNCPPPDNYSLIAYGPRLTEFLK